MINGKQGDNPTTTLVRGYKVTDVTFSANEKCPSFMIANINPRFDIGYNLSRIESIVETAHELKADNSCNESLENKQRYRILLTRKSCYEQEGIFHIQSRNGFAQRSGSVVDCTLAFAPVGNQYSCMGANRDFCCLFDLRDCYFQDR